MIIAGLTLIIGLLNSVIFDAVCTADIMWRVIISIATHCSACVLYGYTFSLRNEQDINDSKYLVAYGWGVNGFFSVLGSVLVVMLSMSYGFRVVFILSALIYLGAMIVVKKLESSNAAKQNRGTSKKRWSLKVLQFTSASYLSKLFDIYYLLFEQYHLLTIYKFIAVWFFCFHSV